ncbi:MAG: hypothetical protein R6V01_07905 [Thermoplasmatota archaeon]
MKAKNEDEDNSVTLKVHQSKINSFDSGIARIHSSHMDGLEGDELEMVELRAGKNNKVVKLVSDRFAKKGLVVLRDGDMEDLGIKDGDEVELHPYHTLSEDLKESWKKFQDRFKPHDEKDEEEEVK